jgi:YD repeat-containing protein
MVQNSSSFVNNMHFPMEADNYTHFALLESSHYSASSPMPDGGILKRFVRRYFQNNAGNMNETIILVKPKLSKEELDCPIVVTNIDELQNAVLIKKIPLRDVSFRFPTNGIGYDDLICGPNDTMHNSGKQQQQRSTMFSRHDPAINGTLSSLLTYEAKTSSNPILRANYQHGIDLLSHHPVLSVVRERVKSKSKPGRRLKSSSSDGAHLALVIEGGGMRGAVSAGMAAALSTLDMLDAFDSIHGSSAGAIVGAYLVSRQLCTDVYTDIMPAAGSRFASKRMGVVNFGVDWLDDVIQRKFLSTSSEDGEEKSDEGAVCDDDNDGNATSLYCDDEDNLSSVEMAMNDQSSSRRPRVWHDDPNDGLVLESARYIFSKVTGPLSSGVTRVGSVLRPALSAIDFASSLRQYLKRRPGMNLT